jgi:flagella basal body P-ring formation protein FlgA
VPAAAEAAGAWNPEKTLREHLESHYPWAEVDVSGLKADAELPARAPVSITVEKTPPGRSVFRFEFEGGKSVQVAASVRVFDHVVMTRSAFRRGYVLRQDDVYTTLMESGRIPKGALREEERVIGKPLLRSVVANRPVTRAVVSDTPLVKRGQKVALVVESPEFSIRTLAEMKHDAAVGEYVKVVSVMSRKILTGLLVDENTVRVEF